MEVEIEALGCSFRLGLLVSPPSGAQRAKRVALEAEEATNEEV
jgi:hypothetical protein